MSRPVSHSVRFGSRCGCESCRAAERAAKRAAYREQQKRAAAAVAELGPRTESHCVGVGGAPCPHRRKLRANSQGNVCCECRTRLVWNGRVPAERARAHLRDLSRRGVGLKAVAAAADVGYTVLQRIASGERTQIRAQSEARILAVGLGAAADGALVDARPTWVKMRRLMRVHGMSLDDISQQIGLAVRLRVGGGRVTARTARRIGELLDKAEAQRGRQQMPAREGEER